MSKPKRKDLTILNYVLSTDEAYYRHEKESIKHSLRRIESRKIKKKRTKRCDYDLGWWSKYGYYLKKDRIVGERITKHIPEMVEDIYETDYVYRPFVDSEGYFYRKRVFVQVKVGEKVTPAYSITHKSIKEWMPIKPYLKRCSPSKKYCKRRGNNIIRIKDNEFISDGWLPQNSEYKKLYDLWWYNFD